MQEEKWGKLNFNISHHGDWVVLASHPSALIGVDVMKINDLPGNQPVNAFLSSFADQLTPYERAVIQGTDQIHLNDERQRLEQFYRLWALKESYIKATGLGLKFQLERAEFHQHPSAPTSDSSHLNKIEHGTRLFLDGIETNSWHFEQHYLDNSHVVAVAFESNHYPSQTTFPDIHFRELQISDLQPRES